MKVNPRTPVSRTGPEDARLTTLTRCFHRYVRTNSERFRVIENNARSYRTCTVVLRDTVEPS
jgi:hypothetical protein